MDSEETLKYLQQKYPEDLNENYRCYWWCTSNIDGSALTYYLVLHDKFCETDKEPMICLRAHSSDPESLVNLFDEYLMNTLTPSTYPTNTKQFRQVIESAPDLYNNMKMLLKIHTKPSVLYKDFLARPLVNKINKNKNQEIV